MKKFWTIALALLLVVVMVAGCAQQAPAETQAPADKPADTPADKPADEPADEPAAPADDFNPADYPVAICMMVYNHPVHRTVQLGFLKKAEELGYTNAQVVGTDLGDDLPAYEAGVQFAKGGGKGLMLWCGNETGWEYIKQCADAGCVVGIAHFNHVDMNGGNLPEGLAFNMACSPTLYGQQVATILAEKCDGKEGSLAITLNTHNLTEDAADQSFRAQWEKEAANYDLSKVTILGTELEGGDLVEATSIIQGILGAHPDIIAAFGTTGNSPQSWSNAATNVGKADGEIAIVGMDATEGNLAALNSGKVVAIVAQPLYEEAAKTMEYLDKVFRGESVPAWTDLEAPVVTVDGQGANGPDYHAALASEVVEYFESKGMQVG